MTVGSGLFYVAVAIFFCGWWLADVLSDGLTINVNVTHENDDADEEPPA
jgi:hypothetical protein